MNKRHYEHTLPNIRGSLSNTYSEVCFSVIVKFHVFQVCICHPWNGCNVTANDLSGIP